MAAIEVLNKTDWQNTYAMSLLVASRGILRMCSDHQGEEKFSASSDCPPRSNVWHAITSRPLVVAGTRARFQKRTARIIMPRFVYFGGTDNNKNDPDFCLRKAEEYWAKARETDHSMMKENFEAIARELEYRAKELKSRRGA